MESRIDYTVMELHGHVCVQYRERCVCMGKRRKDSVF